MSAELQQTEIGEFPSAWSIDRVDSAFDIQQGKQVSKRNRDGEHQRPFLRTKNVFWNRLELTDLDEMHFSEAEQTRLELQANDLLVCEGGSIGRTALWNNEVDGCLYQNHLHRLRAKGDKVHPQFGVYWLWYAFDVANLYFGRGNVTTIPNLSQSKLAELPMALPPLPEQKKIAHILSTVQRAIEAQERIIQTTTELKKTLMHKLFTEGLRNEPQKQTEIGPVPESWEVVPLSDVCRFQSGGTPSKKNPEFWEGTIPWVSPKDMKRPRLADVEDHISQEALESGSKLAPAGSVFVVVRGMILAKTVPVALAEIPMAINQDMKAIVPGPKLRSDFLLYALEALRGNLFKKVGRSGHGTCTLMGHEVAAFKISLPDLAKQVEIASAIQNLERKKELHEEKRMQLQDLFRTLLHELMTAKIRIHELEMPC
ncbi:restriction endonuclease subunit S [Candidatus Accumulibacter cognatus]|uniref:EcoKI restriction-modification system protein HsdS n=1 Tax=Candidatus Accumulibacter cognatus TaxID=2954383 RepID=A0A080M9Y4_9PROT|nr:restriction endonuclease subunit S [Candidatus Accumulibacter cognatus]KFB77801.1 MAG: EcoKI restriction-modification system protein HsdS [Candidatus Accumulibacter cognatus]